jgi:hypothetical protein
MTQEYPVSNRTSSAKGRTDTEVQGRLAQAWSRVIAKVGKGTFADHCGCDPDTVDNALTGKTLPRAHTLLNSLTADPTALDEVLDLYGLRITTKHCEAANDLNVAAGASQIASMICQALADGVRKHHETLQIADIIRPHLPALTAIVREADSLRGAAA